MSAASDYSEVLEQNARNHARADTLECEITELMGHLNAANYRFLTLIREFDAVAPWGNWGLSGCAQWLTWRCGIGKNAAREKVRVAHALAEPPRISEQFARGALSYSNVRAMTRVTTPENEDYLLMIAEHGTAAVDSVRDAEQESAGETPDEAALDVSGETRDIDRGDELTLERRRADALVVLAESYLSTGDRPSSTAERYQVMVHVSAETLRTGESGRSGA